MKERFLIKATVPEQVTYYLLVAFVVTLPFDRLYSELALVCLCAHTLIHLQKDKARGARPVRMLVPAAVYLLTLLGTLYTRFPGEAFPEWERQLAMLLFPLILLFNTFDFKKYVFQIVRVMGFSCAATILYLYYNAFMVIRFNHFPVSAVFSQAFMNHNFSAPIDMHATYFSMYIALAAVAFLYEILHGGEKWARFLYMCVFFVLLAGLIQLSSRAVLISVGIICNVLFPLSFTKKQHRFACIAVSLLLSFAAIYAFTRIDNLRTRFVVEFKEDLSQTNTDKNLPEPRIVRWQAATELIRQSPVYGQGSGSEIPLLKDVYFSHKLYNSYLHSLNVHNQYMSMLIKTGIIGLWVWLYVLFAGFRKAWLARNLLFGSFLVIIATVSFSENILDGNKGIFFFAFFYSLFYLTGEREFIRK